MSSSIDRGSFAPHVPCRCVECARLHAEQSDPEAEEMSLARRRIGALEDQLEAFTIARQAHQESGACFSCTSLLGRIEELETKLELRIHALGESAVESNANVHSLKASFSTIELFLSGREDMRRPALEAATRARVRLEKLK